GLFTPLSEETTNLDLAIALRPCELLLVAPDRLGVLHDLTATLGLAAARGYRVSHVVLSSPAVPDLSTGFNAAELTRLGVARPLAVYPRADEHDAATLASATATFEAIERQAASFQVGAF
ncbi:MAG TPA: dethiobiotin synthase, partial [Polyangiaceae bacterium]